MNSQDWTPLDEAMLISVLMGGEAEERPGGVIRLVLPDHKEKAMSEDMHDGLHTCSLCGCEFLGWGNNPEPLAPFEDRCCDACNMLKVIPARLERMR